MKRLIVGLALILLCAGILAKPVSPARARIAALAQLQRLDNGETLLPPRPLGEATSPLAWIFGLQPQGYIVVSADAELLAAVEAHRETIAAETLAKKLNAVPGSGEMDINGHPCDIQVEKFLE